MSVFNILFGLYLFFALTSWFFPLWFIACFTSWGDFYPEMEQEMPKHYQGKGLESWARIFISVAWPYIILEVVISAVKFGLNGEEEEEEEEEEE